MAFIQKRSTIALLQVEVLQRGKRKIKLLKMSKGWLRNGLRVCKLHLHVC